MKSMKKPGVILLGLIFLLGTAVLGACSTTGEETAAPGSTPLPPATTAPTATPMATETPLPAATPTPAEAAVLPDQLYATAVDATGQDQTLDIHYLPGAAEGKPVVIWAHGTALDSSSGRIFGRLLAREGYVVLAINWQDEITSGGTAADFREALENADCVLRFAAAQGAEYGADPERVIWAGYSAGAWLGSMVALGEGDLAQALDSISVENDGLERRVACVATAEAAPISAYVPSAGSYPDGFWLADGQDSFWAEVMAPLEAYAAVGNNPDLQVRVLHGRRDLASSTAFANAERFAEALQEAGYDVVFLPQDGGHDSFQLEAIAEILRLEE